MISSPHRNHSISTTGSHQHYHKVHTYIHTIIILWETLCRHGILCHPPRVTLNHIDHRFHPPIPKMSPIALPQLPAVSMEATIITTTAAPSIVMILGSWIKVVTTSFPKHPPPPLPPNYYHPILKDAWSRRIIRTALQLWHAWLPHLLRRHVERWHVDVWWKVRRPR